MTSVASEAFALPSRPSLASRTASSKGQPDGGFADLVESQAAPHDTPKAARSERNEPIPPRRADRDAPADKPAPVESSAPSNPPAEADATKTADNTEKPVAESIDSAKPAENAVPAAEEKADGTLIVTGIVPALSLDLPITAPAVAVVAAPVTAAPVETPTEATPIPAVTAPALTATPPLAAPTTVPGRQQAETTGETVAPVETAAAETAPATTLAIPGEQAAAAASAAPQAIKLQTAQNTGQPAADDTTTETETGVATAQAETPDDAAKPAKQAAAQNATPAQAQTGADKPVLNTEYGFKPDDFAAAPKLNADHISSQIPAHMPAHATATSATTPQASPVTTAQAVPVNAIAVEIAGQAKAGNSRFEIRLDPAELGRIDVRLDIDRDGNVTSRLVIERADTYDLLRRDQSTLERALQQAGLKTSDNTLEFSLRDQGFAQQQRQNDDTPRGVRALVAESDVMPSEAANGYARLLGARSGVDIRV